MPIEKAQGKVILKHPKGSSAEILLYGATVISWKAPGPSGSERLFVSSKAALDGSKPVRGGIPVVFPCFGAPDHPDHMKLSQHGFARNTVWAFDHVVMDNEAGVSVRFTLQPNAAIAAVYSKLFHLAYVVTLAEHQLSTNLHVTNPSTTESLDFQALLHTYIRAPANDVTISPLTGRLYIDKTDPNPATRTSLKEEKREVVDVKNFTDAVYEDVPSKIDVIWPGGGLELRMSEFRTLTIWNPQAEAGSKIGDMEERGWEKYVCVEPGFVRGFKKLAAGQTWIGQQLLTVLTLWPKVSWPGPSGPAVRRLEKLRLSVPCETLWPVPVILHYLPFLIFALGRRLYIHFNFFISRPNHNETRMTSRESVLRVQITQIDNTVVHTSLLDHSNLPKAPIIRIYGAASTGQNCCLHVHQVYPYFFVEFMERMDPDSVSRYIASLTYSLNHAVAVSMKRNPESPDSQFVRAIILVKGVHFYGFHSSYSPFLKIHIADPAFVNRAVTIMRSGTVMGTRFRVFESHLSYILQFLCDFGLYGCGWIDLGQVWQRGQDVEEVEGPDAQSKFRLSPCFRQSRMALEVDAVAGQILNRRLLGARNLHHKLAIPAPPLSTEPLVLSVRELWEDERHRRVAAGRSPSPDIPVDPSESSRGEGGEWVAEARWWDEIRKRIERERGEEVKGNEMSWEKWVMTTFESIEALWEDEYKTWKPGRVEGRSMEAEETNPYEDSVGATQGKNQRSQPQTTDIEVDEAMLGSQELSTLVEREEAEWEKLIGGNRIVGSNEEDQDLPEEGPPLDMQLEDSLSRSGTPDLTRCQNEENPFAPRPSLIMPQKNPQKTPRKIPNPFQEAFLKLAGPRYRAASIVLRTEDARNHPVLRTPSLSPKKVPVSSLHASPEFVQQEICEEQERFRTSLEKARQSLLRVNSDKDSDHAAGRPYDTAPYLPPEIQVTKTHSSIVDGEEQPDTSIIFDEESERQMPTFVRIDNDESKPLKRRKVGHEGIRFSSSPRSMFSLTSTSRNGIHRNRQTPRSRLSSSFVPGTPANSYVYSLPPPSVSHLASTTDDYGIPSKIYEVPHYLQEADAPERPREYAGLVYHLCGGIGLKVLEEWVNASSGDCVNQNKLADQLPHEFHSAEMGGWEYASLPPSVKQVKRWLKLEVAESGHAMKRAKMHSQIEGPTQLHPYGLKTSPPNQRPDTAMRERQNMTIFSLEVFAPSRGNLVPDADVDELAAVFFSYQDSDSAPSAGNSSAHRTGIIVIESAQLDPRRQRDFPLEVVQSELDLLNKVVDVVLELDPDVVVGWEIQAASWGYLSARARHFGFDIGEQISRAPGRTFAAGNEQWGLRTTSTFHVVGRHVLNVWRIMRVEQSLNMYTFENTAFHLLRRRVPKYSSVTLTEWYHSSVPAHTAALLRYILGRSSMVLEMLDAAETITKTAEFARIFGVDFFSVISRGSQFKVESFMFRIAKPESFVLLSPSKDDVGKQNAAECMPLIMEPLSAFYNSPLIVLDFQSLYPSVMIAYNYCYSTCLGRVTAFKGQNKFGVTELNHPTGLLNTLQEHILVAPNGMMYVKPQVRKGLLGRMLTELLETRVMVKQAMKGVKGNKALTRILDARQLGLKYISNVTYGYTSATYSGRMPAVEIADSIVQTGRETLEKAVKLIDSTGKWGARVVYGDTDSLFIYLRGRTKEQAFRIGHDIADTITAMNPTPIKLKFEKVYLPCVLMAKKRYVGFKYENPDDVEPIFDAKGIETVRRDGVLAQQKMTETALKILFRSQDLSEVKEYCCRSWSKILENKVSIQDFVFAREVKLGTYSDKVPPPPGVTVAARKMMQDQNDEPQYGDRIPYVIVRGEPNARLVDRAMAPEEVVDFRRKRLDGAYYISKVLIPPLERIFNLVGADVRGWYDEMPKRIRADQVDAVLMSPKKAHKEAISFDRPKIEEHFRSFQCMTCGAVTSQGICEDCRSTPQETVMGLLSRLRVTEDRLRTGHQICASCTESAPSEPIRCQSLDCPWYFERKKAEAKADDVALIQELLDEIADVEGARARAECWFYGFGVLEAGRLLGKISNSDCGQSHSPLLSQIPTIKSEELGRACHANLGNAIKDMGRPWEALDFFQRAVAVNPGFPEAVCGLANSHSAICDWRGRGLVSKDLRVDQNGLMIHPSHSAELGNQGWMPKTVAITEEQLDMNYAHNVGLIASLVRLARTAHSAGDNAGDGQHASTASAAILIGFRTTGTRYGKVHRSEERSAPLSLDASQSFLRLWLPTSIEPPQILSVLPLHTPAYDSHHISWLGFPNMYILLQHPFPRQDQYRDHPLGHLMQSVFGLHDETFVNVFVYATSASDGSTHRCKIESESQFFVDVSTWTAKAVVERILEDGIHISVSVCIPGRSNAHVQTMENLSDQLGHVGGRFEIPTHQTCFIETLMRIVARTVRLLAYFHGDRSQAVLSRRRATVAEGARKDPFGNSLGTKKGGGRNREKGFCQISLSNWRSMNTILNTAFTALQGRTLYFCRSATHPKEVPQQRPLAAPFPSRRRGNNSCGRQNSGLETQIAARTLRFDNVKEEHIARGHVTDMFLDAIECNAHTIAAEYVLSFIWLYDMLISMYTYKMCSRVGASVVRTTGFGNQMIMNSLEEYEDRAVSLAGSVRYSGERTSTGSVTKGHGELINLRRNLFLDRYNVSLFDTAVGPGMSKRDVLSSSVDG
ncbi:hypothetical protein EW146_g3727 [Bondarzewia mesenterica]|uniref:DNA polymerase zeta catalytic subunit n=1 Tax=Bondarzewia mesenterica TaxID=1095465 RepID=A0A4S4LX81_9AGAM|nr:hypothetical protein EW146_g3727 [Bondarzewia mesenterica]